MQICHVTSVHSAKDDRIFYRECLSLVNAGYTILEIAPNVPDEMYNGVRIYGVQVPKNKWKRSFFGKKAIYNKCVELDADVYHFHDPELMPVGVKLKKEHDKCVVFDSHEDVPAQILMKEWIPSFLRKSTSKIYALYEKGKLKLYDALVSVTPSIVKRLEKINTNTFQITNYPILSTMSCKDNRKWEDSIVCAGNIAPERMHHNMLMALKDIPYVKLRLAGPYVNSYMQYLQTLPAWKQVEYAGILPFTDIPEFTAQSSIGIIINDYYPNAGYKLGSLGTIKIFEFMQAGIPVICTDFILWKEIIDEWKCGICVNPHDIDAIRNAIVYLIENKDIAKQMGDNGRHAVMEKYNWNTQEKILLEMYKKLEEKCK